MKKKMESFNKLVLSEFVKDILKNQNNKYDQFMSYEFINEEENYFQ